ncbi:MAG: futalosine hydrolase [Bacteroidales bacterium]|nr:futalosine hydrolase [Bacteroidales bacterium]
MKVKMKQLLIVSATNFEISSYAHHLGLILNEDNNLFQVVDNNLSISILISGIGATPTTFHLSRTLLQKKYDFVLNAGIAGTFRRDFFLGDVVRVEKDFFADMGFESDKGFFPLNAVKEIDPEHICLKEENLNPLKINIYTQLPIVTGITVNTISGSEAVINKYKKLYAPDIETMEGAAFLYVCSRMKIMAGQIRAISNYIEARDKSKWQTEKAVQNLTNVLLRITEELRNE